jgi:2,3-bisphosphoglycerate-dependent phosphoglycerate mutase
MNVQELFSGHTDTPLTGEGHNQAKKAGEKARQAGLNFDIIISSPLQRAHHTAKHIAEAVGYPADRIELSDLLKERHFGSLEGLHRDHKVFDRYLEDESSIDHHEEVESLEDLHARAERTLEYLQSLKHDTVLIVTHGGFGRALYRVINDLPLDARDIRYQNAELVRFI